MFGIGHWEVLILLTLALMTFGALVVIAAAVAITRRSVASGNLTPCPDCGRLVSKLAATCPQCGRPLR